MNLPWWVLALYVFCAASFLVVCSDGAPIPGGSVPSAADDSSFVATLFEGAAVAASNAAVDFVRRALAGVPSLSSLLQSPPPTPSPSPVVAAVPGASSGAPEAVLLCMDVASSRRLAPSSPGGADLFTARFVRRKDAKIAIKLHVFRTRPTAKMRCASDISGGESAFYVCGTCDPTNPNPIMFKASMSDTQQDGVYWTVSEREGGEHVSCKSGRGNVLGVEAAMELPAVRAQLNNQRSPLEIGEVRPAAVAAGAQFSGLNMSRSDISKTKAHMRHALSVEVQDDWESIWYYCSEVVRLNPGTKAFLELDNVRTKERSDVVFSFDTATGSAATTSPIPTSLDTYRWHSVIIIPRSTYDLVQFNPTAIFVDFGRMFHADGETDVMEVIVNSQLANHNVGLLHGLMEDAECGAHWARVRKVRYPALFCCSMYPSVAHRPTLFATTFLS